MSLSMQQERSANVANHDVVSKCKQQNLGLGGWGGGGVEAGPGGGGGGDEAMVFPQRKTKGTPLKTREDRTNPSCVRGGGAHVQSVCP